MFPLALNILSPILFDISCSEGDISSSGHLLFNQMWLCSLDAGLFRELILGSSSHKSYPTRSLLTSTPRPVPVSVSCSVWPWVAPCPLMLSLSSSRGAEPGDPSGFLWPHEQTMQLFEECILRVHFWLIGGMRRNLRVSSTVHVYFYVFNIFKYFIWGTLNQFWIFRS